MSFLTLYSFTRSRRRAARLDAGHVRDVVVGVAGCDHRPHHGVLPHAEVDQHRTVVDLVGLLDAFDGLVLGERAHTHAAVRFGELHEVRHVHDVRRVLAVQQVRGGVVVIVEQGLPLADHAVHGVVEQGDLHRRVVEERGRQLFGGHLEGAVAVDEPHRLLVVEFAGGATRAPMAPAGRSPSCPGRRRTARSGAC